MAQFFDVNSTPAGTAIKTLLDLSQLQRQDATTKNLESDSRMREMQTASLGQEMAAQQQSMQRQMEFRQGVSQMLGQQQQLTPDGQSPGDTQDAKVAAQAADPNVQMAKNVQNWTQQRAMVAKMEALALSKGIGGQDVIDLRTRGNELDQKILKGQEDLVKYNQKRGEMAANVLRGVDNPQSLDAGLNHIDSLYPGQGQAIRQKLLPDPQTGVVDPTTPANKAILDPYINSYINIGADLKNKQIENNAAYREQLLGLKQQSLDQREAMNQVLMAVKQAGVNIDLSKLSLAQQQFQLNVDKFLNSQGKPDPADKARETAAVRAGGPATEKQQQMVRDSLTADPAFKDVQWDSTQPGFVADVANRANALRAGEIRNGNTDYGYDEAIGEAVKQLSPFVTTKSSGGATVPTGVPLIGGKTLIEPTITKTYTRSSGQAAAKEAAVQQAGDQAKAQAEAQAKNTPIPVPPKKDLVAGQTYTTSRGPAKWDGNQFVQAK